MNPWLTGLIVLATVIAVGSGNPVPSLSEDNVGLPKHLEAGLGLSGFTDLNRAERSPDGEGARPVEIVIEWTNKGPSGDEEIVSKLSSQLQQQNVNLLDLVGGSPSGMAFILDKDNNVSGLGLESIQTKVSSSTTLEEACMKIADAVQTATGGNLESLRKITINLLLTSASSKKKRTPKGPRRFLTRKRDYRSPDVTEYSGQYLRRGPQKPPHRGNSNRNTQKRRPWKKAQRAKASHPPGCQCSQCKCGCGKSNDNAYKSPCSRGNSCSKGNSYLPFYGSQPETEDYGYSGYQQPSTSPYDYGQEETSQLYVPGYSGTQATGYENEYPSAGYPDYY